MGQITLIMDIEICNLSNIYPRRHCSVACMLISIPMKKDWSKVYTKFIYKFNIQSPYIQSPSKVHCIYHTGSNKCFFICLVPYTHICLYYFLILYSCFRLVSLTFLPRDTFYNLQCLIRFHYNFPKIKKHLIVQCERKVKNK